MSESENGRAEALARIDVFADCTASDLVPLARLLRPLRAATGEVLMVQGEPADEFLIIAEGSVAITREPRDESDPPLTADAGRILGELALLRHSPRSATVTAITALAGWSGDDAAFDLLIELPGVLERLERTARQRLAAFITPVPVRLSDGRELLLRPVLPGDRARTEHSHITFSSDTFYRRFQTVRQPGQKLMRYLFVVDYVDHFVWVVVTPDGDLVADARFVRDEDDPTRAEIAFLVGDDYQGQGIGTFLMGALAIAARVAGVTRFHAWVLTDNLPMRAILDRAGAQWKRDDLHMVTTDVPVPQQVPFDDDTARGIEAMAARVLRQL
ncbi:MAG: GNAT family N-acetyltransferase [Mycolicibacterium insubricum]|nr:GNAT family N-acetyltransferase [Mycobacterium sp.]